MTTLGTGWRRAESLWVVCLCAAALSVPARGHAAETDRHWAIGWDGRNGAPMLRWRPAAGWDVSLAAGPDDSKGDRDRYRFSSDYSPQQQGNLEHTSHRRESGWVRLSGGRRIWSDGRFALAADVGVAVRWENSQDTYRSLTTTAPPDVHNTRQAGHSNDWTLEALLRPSFALSSRLSVEFDVGLQVGWGSVTDSDSGWYDVSPEYTRVETRSHGATFRTIGRFDWSALKFVFWL